MVALAVIPWGGVGACLTFYVVPVPTRSSVAVYQTASEGENFASQTCACLTGSQVMEWRSVPAGASTVFGIETPGCRPFFRRSGNSGTFSFTASDATYWFCTSSSGPPVTTYVNGTYFARLL